MKPTIPKHLARAIDLLNQNQVIASPTDTVYGLLARAESSEAYKKLVFLKKRSPDKPFITLINSINQVKKWAYVTPLHLCFIKNIWPSPVTIILKSRDTCPEYLVSREKTIAFRWPNNELLDQLIGRVGPLLAPSANPAGKNPATTGQQVKNYFGSKGVFIIEAETDIGQPSTIMDLSKNFSMLREGKIKEKQIKKVFSNCQAMQK